MKAHSLSLLIALCIAWPVPNRAAEPVSFRDAIAPLLARHCLACHEARRREGGYRVDAFAHFLAAGDSGETPIAPGKPAESEVWRRVTTADESLRMPQDGEPLAAAELALLKQWIEAGAKCDERDQQAPLLTLLPAVEHPQAPQQYPAAWPITAIAFDRAGETLFTAGYHEVLQWKVADGTLVRRWGNLPQRIHAITLSPDGERMAVAGGEPGVAGETRMVRCDSGKVERVLAPAADVTWAAAWSPTGRWLATGGAEQPIHIYDANSGQLWHTFASHSDWVFSLTWDSTGDYLLSASRDQTAKLFHVPSRKLVQTYWGHAAAVHGAVFKPESTELFSVGHDEQLHRWQRAEGKKLRSSPLAAPGTTLVAASDRLFIGLPTGALRQANFDGKLAREHLGNSQGVVSLAVHPASEIVAAGTETGAVVLWRFRDPQPIRTWTALPRE